jgi:predicted transcriptional regulator
MSGDVPPKPRRVAHTKQINIRMDVDLLARLEQHAPGQRRSVSNMIIKAVADYLDRLDDERRIREAIRNNQHLLAGMSPRELRQLVERQHMMLGRLPTVQGPLPPLPPPKPPRNKRHRK